ncbi:MAG: 4-hydroxy-3-methylbut-2-en-1-yl diphosphate synthase, partial [Spirochaetae bacterium HGW-Spirochaetae-6]
DAGAQIVRLAVLDQEDADALPALILQSPVPLIADIHFDARLALRSLEAGIAGLRLNPGNIKNKSEIKSIVESAASRKVPIRIGVNAGSLDKERFSHPTAENMVKSALEHLAILEELDFFDIKVSLKSSDLTTMIEAYRLFAPLRDYPLHLGVTEAGPLLTSAVRSSMGIGTLLLDGIGDTIRVSVSGDPVKELPIAREILVSLNLRPGIKWISCPSCGRTTVDTEALTIQLQNEFNSLELPITIAVMGCVVNGPGEAREADLALVGGPLESLIYLKGQLLKKIPNAEILSAMRQAIQENF